MSKILNWTFGACFRTLGRFLAIFLVGVLLIFIGSKIGIELPDWLALRVYAMDYANASDWSTNLPSLSRFDFRGCNSTNCWLDVTTEQNTFTTGFGDRTFIVNQTPLDIGNNGYRIMSPGGQMKKNYLYSVSYYVCSNQNLRNINTWSLYAGAYDGIDPQRYSNNLYNSYNLSSLSGLPGTGDDGKYWSNCYAFNSLLVPEQDYTWLILSLSNSSGVLNNYYISGISVKVSELGIYTTAIEDTIKNSGFATSESVEQVQESVDKVEQEIQQTNDTITNDDTSGAQGSADGFFNDFQSEDFGLSSIVTAPLRGINAMLSDTCVAPSATYKGQTFSLPCGSMLWSRPGGEDFKSFINVMYGGFLAYLVIRKFFLDVETLKNPNSDKVEVDKL